jgi:hypothetical protein
MIGTYFLTINEMRQTIMIFKTYNQTFQNYYFLFLIKAACLHIYANVHENFENIFESKILRKDQRK